MRRYILRVNDLAIGDGKRYENREKVLNIHVCIWIKAGGKALKSIGTHRVLFEPD